MEILSWLDKDFNEIKSTILFGKYFDSILQEDGVDVTYLFNPSRGIDIILRPDNSIKAIHFYSGKDGLTSKFTGTLPFGLMFSQSRSDAKFLLGEPSKSGGGEKSLLYNQTKKWDKYFFEGYSLHLQFADVDSTIDLVTAISIKES